MLLLPLPPPTIESVACGPPCKCKDPAITSSPPAQVPIMHMQQHHHPGPQHHHYTLAQHHHTQQHHHTPHGTIIMHTTTTRQSSRGCALCLCPVATGPAEMALSAGLGEAKAGSRPRHRVANQRQAPRRPSGRSPPHLLCLLCLLRFLTQNLNEMLFASQASLMRLLSDSEIPF